MEWISVDDRLPELHKSVLVCVHGSVNKGCYRGEDKETSPNGWCWLGALDKFDERNRGVTHWMPLPSPPCQS